VDQGIGHIGMHGNTLSIVIRTCEGVVERVEPCSQSTSMVSLSKPKVGFLSAPQPDSEGQQWKRVTANRGRK
jgi:hypothetical protein